MKKCAFIAAVAVLAVLSPEVLAQSAPTATGENWGFFSWTKNIKATVLEFVDLALFGSAAVGVLFGIFAIGPVRELLDSPPGQPKPWGKAGSLVLGCVLGLGVSYWVYAISSSVTGDGGKAGEAGKVIHERYKGG